MSDLDDTDFIEGEFKEVVPETGEIVTPGESAPAATPTPAPAPKTATPAPTRADTGGEPAPAPAPLSAPTTQIPQEHLCPKHPGQEFKNYPTKAGGTVWAHKIGMGLDGKPTWCFEEEVLKEQRVATTSVQATPDDMDAVDVKDNNEFLTVLHELEEKLGWRGEQLKHFLETNYPTSGTDVRDLPVAIRRPLLKDLNALIKAQHNA
jgi:hypothetical protein